MAGIFLPLQQKIIDIAVMYTDIYRDTAYLCASMTQLIASYLFQNKTCPLPGLGTLFIHITGAEADFTTKQIKAPAMLIQLQNKETDVASLLSYIASGTNSSLQDATTALDYLCSKLKKEMTDHAAAALPGIGEFFIGKDGKVSLKQEELSLAFFQPVNAERVIHPKAEHQILVGDKETTNTVMAEYFNETIPIKNRWWIWAIVLGALALVLLLLYFNGSHAASRFGNAVKI
jgi:hypothetical protein